MNTHDFSKLDTGIVIRDGAYYVDGHGDVKGPMHERQPGIWLDQHGALFHGNGIQWNHVPKSAGNLKAEVAQPEQGGATGRVERAKKYLCAGNFCACGTCTW